LTDPAVAPLPEGLQLGDEFRVERMLGRGGFGITYLVRSAKRVDAHVIANERYVVKELAISDYVRRTGDGVGLEPIGDTEERRAHHWRLFQLQIERVESEARTLARFRHRHIVEVLLIRRANQTAYIVMEFISGTPLSDLVWRTTQTRGSGLTWPELKPVAAQLLEALEHIHKHDIIHRDIKPDNIMIRDAGEAVMIDFGGARQGTKARGSMVFTPGHAPIEQIHNYLQGGDTEDKLAPIGKATDIYGMAATFYTALTGSAPYAVDRQLSRFEHRPALKDHPERSRMQLPDRVADAIDRALNFSEPGARPQDVAQWRALFDDLSPNLSARYPGRESAESLFHEAERLRLMKSDPARCLDLYRQAASSGHVGALYRLGRLFQTGEMVSRNADKAGSHFDEAASKGYAPACFRLAELYLESDEPERAYLMAHRAADDGFPPAINLVGRFYRKGIYVQQSDSKACDWYERAFKGGSPEGAQNLAAMYDRGLGRPRSPDLARKLTLAAERLRNGAAPEDVLSDTPHLIRTAEGG
jgi:serine/threonine protein kinase